MTLVLLSVVMPRFDLRQVVLSSPQLSRHAALRLAVTRSQFLVHLSLVVAVSPERILFHFDAVTLQCTGNYVEDNIRCCWFPRAIDYARIYCL